MNKHIPKLAIEPGLNKTLLRAHSETEVRHQWEQNNYYSAFSADEVSESSMANLEQKVFLFNLEKFNELLDSQPYGGHCYNDISQFKNVPILTEGWAYGGRNKDWIFKGFTPTRNEKRDYYNKMVKYELLFSVVDFSPLAPILFDREWRIIDGYHRYWGICHLPGGMQKKFYFRQLDF